MEVRKYTIRELRARNKISQLELGKKCGLSRQMISGYETGIYKPKHTTLARLAEALHVDIAEIQL